MGKYDDIINMPHHVSKTHKPMSMKDRAEQFAPFAALSGFSESVDESNRYVGPRLDLDEDRIEEIRLALDDIKKMGGADAIVEYFVEDALKPGGEYITKEGFVNVDEDNKVIIIDNDAFIPMLDLFSVDIL